MLVLFHIMSIAIQPLSFTLNVAMSSIEFQIDDCNFSVESAQQKKRDGRFYSKIL